MDVLVARYHGKLLDFVYRHLRNREAAADIAQTTLVRAFENAARYRARACFKTWLYTIALNLVRDHLRRAAVRGEVLMSEEALHANETLPNHEPAVEDAVLDRLLMSRVWDAIGSLPEGPQSAMILRFRQGLTYDEIADVMDAPSGTVKSWIHHGLKTLRETLGPLDWEG